MNRRSFIKLLGSTTLIASLPTEFLVDNGDAETKFLEDLLNHESDELVVISCLREYIYGLKSASDATISQIMKEISERQEFVIKLLKSRVDISDTSRWAISKNYLNYEDTRWLGYQRYIELANKYGIPVGDKIYTTREAYLASMGWVG